MMKKIISLFLVVGFATAQGYHDDRQDDVAAMAVATVLIGGCAAIIYATTDSNHTLLTRADSYIEKVDLCIDLLPPVSWTDTQEAYFAYYVQNKFGLRCPVDINEKTSQILDTYIAKSKNNVSLARQCVEFRSSFYGEMQRKLIEIEKLESLLQKASVISRSLYHNFFLAQQVKNLDNALHDIDTCLDLLPSPSWGYTFEAYIEYYFHHKFTLEISQINNSSSKILMNYIEIQKNKLAAAHQLALYLSKNGQNMNGRLSEIAAASMLLKEASLNVATYYDDFVLSHQIINFYGDLPTYDRDWIVYSSVSEQGNKITNWIRRGLFGNRKYPLLAFKDYVVNDIKIINGFLGKRNFSVCYPVIYSQLMLCREAIERCYDLLLNSSQFKDEKDDKYRADLIEAEQERIRIAQQAAYAAQQAAEQAARIARQAAQAQQDAADAQLRQARALEESNRIAAQRNRDEAYRDGRY